MAALRFPRLAVLLAAAGVLAACDDLPTLPGRTPLGARADVVPAAAPDGVSDSVLAASRDAAHVMTDAGIPGRVVRDRVWLRFRDDASAAERQRAVDSVYGTVLGGLRLGGDGVYYVALPVPPDSGAGPLLRAIATLRALPQVRFATIDDLDGPSPAYLLPKDGASYGGWRLHPDSARGANWGAEAIAAPMAWGCATGTDRTGVAVVDVGFVSAEDLAPNVAPGMQLSDAAPTDHGTRVASIIGAAGDNGAGMTGLLWHARLGLFDVQAPNADGPGGAWQGAFAVRAAARAGYRVINLSAGLDWQARFGRLPNDTPGDSAKADAARYELETLLDDVRATQSDNARPLVVLAAANDGVDAYWSGYAAAKLDGDYASQLVVVAATRNATTSAERLAAFSNRGALVDVAAPGEDVGTLTGAGDVALASGTSLAAPHASGVAGLLLALDPTLGTDSLRAYLLRGADAGGRVADDPSNANRPIPVLNAYESLKLAAQRPGGPLCGNRVWSDSARVMVQRGDGVEALATAADLVTDVRAQHGGRVGYTSGGEDHELLFRDGAWVDAATTAAAPDTLPGGADRSRSATSHGGDSVAYLAGDELHVQAIATGDDRTLASVADVSALGADDSAAVCVEASNADGTGGCSARLGSMLTESADGLSRATLAYSPFGDEVYVAQPYASSTMLSLGGWAACPAPGAGGCRASTVRRAVDSTVVVAVQIATGRTTRLFALAGQQVLDLTVSEGSEPGRQELAVQSAPAAVTWQLRGASPDPGARESWSSGGCALTFRSRAGDVLMDVPTTCAGDFSYAGPTSTGTFAPMRAPRHASRHASPHASRNPTGRGWRSGGGHRSQ